MITTYFNPADIVYACTEIRANGETPVLYVSSANAARLVEFSPVMFKFSSSTTIDEDEYNQGYIGKYKGALVYTTDAVGDCYVIVPQCKEDKTNE